MRSSGRRYGLKHSRNRGDAERRQAVLVRGVGKWPMAPWKKQVLHARILSRFRLWKIQSGGLERKRRIPWAICRPYTQIQGGGPSTRGALGGGGRASLRWGFFMQTAFFL